MAATPHRTARLTAPLVTALTALTIGAALAGASQPREHEKLLKPIELPAVRRVFALAPGQGVDSIPRDKLAEALRALADEVWKFMPFPGQQPPLSLRSAVGEQGWTFDRTDRHTRFRPGHRPVVLSRTFALGLLAGKSEAMHGLIHEWAHSFQSRATFDKRVATGPSSGTDIRLNEGAADAFADLVAPALFRDSGLAYTRGDYHGYPPSVLNAAWAKGRNWILHDQFAPAVRPDSESTR
jgi:hypothetical protein